MPFSARVLVFDQGESQPLAIDSLLKDNGYRPFVAETLDEATAIVGKARPDVAIYNSTTDGSDNADTIQSLKDHWRAEHMPLIVVGEDPELDAKRFYRSEDGIIVITPEMLEAMLTEATPSEAAIK